jgi:hypothetical protein
VLDVHDAVAVVKSVNDAHSAKKGNIALNQLHCKGFQKKQTDICPSCKGAAFWTDSKNISCFAPIFHVMMTASLT